ncbi:MAG: tetratricopeptide repeat protein [Myxococcales bacterium]|nr:tetratricopeptide repeat protein [Myxococcales bacterium]
MMRGADGRVCVADFGLASAADASDLADTVPPLDVDAAGTTMPGLLLSRTGELKGSPAYMPPEQFGERPVDARADQFAFCVALYEGLWGRRPFAEGSLQARYLAAVHGPTAPPGGGEVPAWMWPVLARGLARDPEDRWPDMPALLDALAAASERRTRWRRRGALGLALGLTAAAAGLGGAALWSPADAASCAAEADGLAAVWDDERREALRRAFVATGAPWAADTAERTIAGLDARRAAWERVVVEACAARRAGGDALWYARQSGCLAERRGELGLLIDELIAADAAVIPRALAAVAELEAPRRCLDDPSAPSPTPAPAPAERAAVQALARELDGVEAAIRVARYGAALTALAELEPRALRTGHAPLQARLLELRGRAALWGADAAGGVAALEQAADLAEAGRDDRELAEVWRYLAMWALVEARDATRGLAWLRRASASRGRLGVDPARSGELAALRGHHRLLLHEFAAAEQEFRAAVAAHERDERPLRLLEARRALADALGRQGRQEAALAELRGALAEAERALGPHHPIYAATAHDVGATLMSLGRVDEAAEHLRAAASVWADSPDEPRPDLGALYLERARLALAAGRLDESDRELDRAAAIVRATRPAMHPELGDVASGRAAVAFARGDFAAARRALDEVIAVYRAAFGADDVYLAKVTAERGWVAVAEGRVDAAAADFAAADAVLARSPESRGLRESSLRGLAVIAGGRGEPAAALALLMQVDVAACAPEARANYHLWRAVLHRRLGARGQAREHHAAARAAIAEARRTGELAAMRVTPAELAAIDPE